ncbi:MAG: ComF family protein [Oscillospiraceae bacterium]|nr:ComF family protein [Oscillospiraceae bacterium]
MNRPSMFLLDLLWPNRCGCCGLRIAFDRLLCPDCAAALDAIPADYDAWAAQCTGAVPWDGAAAAFRYDGAAKAGVLAMKDGGRNFGYYAAKRLAECVKCCMMPELPDLVTWVPITKKRRRMQGYCHAELLGKAVASELNCPARGDLLSEQAGSVRQHQISGKERAEYAGRFHSTGRRLNGMTVLLCDDVLTSGSTMRQCTALLRNAGAARVFIAAATLRMPQTTPAHDEP